MQLVSPTDPILLQQANPVMFPSSSLTRIYADLLSTMLYNHGCGLAAPQVGIPLRLFTYNAGSEVGILINPRIIERSPELVDSKEGCLTFPGEFWTVKRSKEIVVTYQDLGGKCITRKTDGLLAVIIQHETDHLNGILIPQHGKKE